MPQHLADLGEDRSLDLLALGRRLDDEAAGRHAVDAVDRFDPGERLVARGGGDLLLLHQPVERPGDADLARFRAFLRHVGQQHVIARLCRNLRDPRAHLSRPDHAYRLHEAVPSSSMSRVSYRFIARRASMAPCLRSCSSPPTRRTGSGSDQDLRRLGGRLRQCPSLRDDLADARPGNGRRHRRRRLAVDNARTGAGGGFTVDVTVPDSAKGEISVRVDDKVIAGGGVRNGAITLGGDMAARIVAAMIAGRKASVTAVGGAEIGHVSLAGSSAALRFIDAEQGRAGSVTAAVAKGAKPAGAVPAALPLPVVPSVAANGTPAPVTPALRKAMLAASTCDAEDANTKDALSAWALGGGKTLVLLPCGAGAYNYMSVPFIVAGGKPVRATFNSPVGFGGEPGTDPMLVNAEWDETRYRLTSYAKGRGMGDCGSSETLCVGRHALSPDRGDPDG